MMPSTTFRKKSGSILRRVVIPLAFWLGVWQLAAFFVDMALERNSELLLPGPVTVLRALLRLAVTAGFWQDAAASLVRIFGGFAAGALLGTLCAVLAAVSVWAAYLLTPAIKVVRATPVASFIVLILLWAPTGQVPAIVSALMVIPVLWGNVSSGVGETNPLLLEAAKAYRFTKGKTVRLVYIPEVLPYFTSGCSTGLGLAWKAGVAAEVLCQPRMAIGSRLYGAKITLETPDLFAWTIVVIVLSFLLESALGALFRRIGGRAKA